MKPILVACLMLILSGCAATLTDYKNTQPTLNLRDYFSGQIRAYGLFQDYSGKVTRTFTVDLQGNWQGKSGVLHEEFVFDDGEQQTRDWYLTELDTLRYEGKASDVVGVAQGEIVGRALRWRYTLSVPVDGETYEFEFDDWMWQFDQKRMFNKAKMKKWGFTVGEITLFFEKVGD